MGPQSFGKNYRLCQSKDFQRVFRARKRFRESFLTVYFYPNHRSHVRLGKVVPKKAIRLSTRRHRCRRIIQESVRLNQKYLQGYDLVIMVLKGQRDYEAKHIPLLLDRIWQKFKELKPFFGRIESL